MSENCDQGCVICAEFPSGRLPSEMTDAERNELARQMIMAMTRDIGANPDLAAKLWVTLKLAAEKIQ